MKFFSIISLLFFFISCGQQEKSIKDGVIVDSLLPKNNLVINAADTLTDSSKLIIPGKSLGPIYLMERSDSVFLKLGKPDAGDAAMGKSVSIYKNKDNNTDLKIYFVTNMGAQNEAPRAKLIHTNSSFFTTENNIKVGSTLEEIKEYFLDIKHIAVVTINKDSLQLFDAEKEGITFEVDSKNICRGLTVHLVGEGLQPTYLPFYDSFEFIKK